MQFTNNSLCRSLMSVVTETSDEDPDDFANFSGLLPPNIWRAALEGKAQAVTAWLEFQEEVVGNGSSVDACCAEYHGLPSLLMAAAEGGEEAIVRMLLQRGAYVDLQDSEGATALVHAATGGHTAVVQVLLDAKADTSLQTEGGSTALATAEQLMHEAGEANMAAEVRKHAATAQLLRQHAERQEAEAEVEAKARATASASCRGGTGYRQAFEAARATARATDRCEIYQTWAMSLPANILGAAREGVAQVVTAWLDYQHEAGLPGCMHAGQGIGVDTRCADDEGCTLLIAAAGGGHEAMVRMLLQRGASVNLQDRLGSSGSTALMHAAACGHTSVVQVLLDAKADASLRNFRGLTALMAAEVNKRTATARLLRQHAQKAEAEAVASVKAEAAAEAAAEAMAKELLAEEEAEKQAATKKGKGKKKKATGLAATPSASASTPTAAQEGLPGLPADVCHAASFGEPGTEVVAAWLDKSGDVNARGIEHAPAVFSSTTLLMAAAQHGNEAVVRMLLQRGARVDLHTSTVHPSPGYTALMLAASQGHTKVVLELLEAKADASLSNADGETALMLAHDMISIYRRPAPRARR